MLTNSLKILDTSKTNSFELSYFENDKKYDKKTAVWTEVIFRNL